jgi:hypothetical protein
MGKEMNAMISIDSPIPPEEFLHRFTLIIGEVNTGKTTLTQKILDAFLQADGGRVAVVDLAPDIGPSDLKGRTAGIGGTLKATGDHRVRYYHCPIHAPRLQGKDELETLRLADENAQLIESLFEQALEEKVDGLFVNDCSLYLQAGEPHKLIRWIGSPETAIVNGYDGEFLGPGILSTRERAGMADLINHCDHLIRLTKKYDT